MNEEDIEALEKLSTYCLLYGFILREEDKRRRLQIKLLKIRLSQKR